MATRRHSSAWTACRRPVDRQPVWPYRVVRAETRGPAVGQAGGHGPTDRPVEFDPAERNRAAHVGDRNSMRTEPVTLINVVGPCSSCHAADALRAVWPCSQSRGASRSSTVR
jgi:hypothetical protein